jgi:hypothetical protein
MFMIDDKNTQIFIVFIINHKHSINIVYLVRFLWWRTNVSWKYPPPLACSPRGVFTNLRVTFELLLLKFWQDNCIGRFSPFKYNQCFQFFRLGLFYNELLLDTVIKIHRKRRCGIYRAKKRRAIAMAPYFTKYRRTQYRR